MLIPGRFAGLWADIAQRRMATLPIIERFGKSLIADSDMKNLQRDEKTYAIIGVAMEVHKQLGYGFLEGVYQEALALEMSLRQVPFEREVKLPVYYKNQKLNTSYRVDFVCFENIVVELKALS